MIDDDDENKKCMFLVWIDALDEEFAFKLFDDGEDREKDSYLAEDFMGNFIEVVDGKIYAYVHDSEPFHFLLFKNKKEFLKNIELLTFDEYQDIVDSQD